MKAFRKTVYTEENQVFEESLFAVGNGYLGVRGAFEEGYPSGESIRGSYINGLYDRVGMVHAEMAYGFPTEQDKQPRIMDTQTCEVWADGERVQLIEGRYAHYERYIDYVNGYTLRRYQFTHSNGKPVEVSFKRLASFQWTNVCLYEIDVTYDGEIELKSMLDTDVENYTNPKDPRTGQGHSKLMVLDKIGVDKHAVYAQMHTQTSGLTQATWVEHISNNGRIEHRTAQSLVRTLIKGEKFVSLKKIVVFTDSLRSSSPLSEAKALASQLKVEELYKSQKSFLKSFWDRSLVTINGDDEAQEAVTFMQYQLLQSVGHDAYSNVSAKGLTGEGYEGHYFWDTEIYVLPVIMMTQPERAKALLSYRSRLLPQAIERARELGHDKGATYAWRTISGIECSGYFPAGTAQYHINADIAYGFILYHLYTQDWDFLVEKGAEVLFETGRTWLDMGHYHQGKFMIHNVTGPDEYTAIVNNNYYTNAMAKYHLYWNAKLYDVLVNHEDATLKEAFANLCERIHLSRAEIDDMRAASDNMYFHYDEERQLYAQDDAFMTKPIWPFEKRDPKKKPLLLHYYPLTIYRHQVLKQADTLLAHFLLEDYAALPSIKNAYHYYETITTHDSSLSSCIYGIMASRIGAYDDAYAYFKESLFLDLKDTHHNTKDGLHMANIAGSILSVVAGFGGLRVTEKGLTLRPNKPSKWTSYSFRLSYQERLIYIEVSDAVRLTLESGEPLEVMVWETTQHLVADKVVTVYAQA